MISLIICSKKSTLSNSLSRNIAETIGVPYEVILIDNSKNEYSICEAYNLGALKSKFDVLCFVHDDVLLHTDNWGRLVTNHLTKDNIGLIGVAGAVVKTKNISPWWITGHSDVSYYHRINIIHSKKNEAEERLNVNPENEELSEVVVLDGVWICCRKEIWQKIKFDATTFKNFHFYDLDFSLAVHKAGYKNVVTYDILVEHFSTGSVNKSWINDSLAFHKKWEKSLPASTYRVEESQLKFLEKSAIINQIHELIINKTGFVSGLILWVKLLLKKSFDRETFSLLKHYLKQQKVFA